MTHRHKNQTDERQIAEIKASIRLQRKRQQRALLPRRKWLSTDDGGPTDSNHGSRTDSNTRGGKA
jgi:hypothetical protein